MARLVLTVSGALIALQSMADGDARSAVPAQPTETRAARVVATIAHPSKRILTLHVGSATIMTTPDHPFYVAGEGFRRAGDLAPGARLLRRDGSEVALANPLNCL